MKITVIVPTYNRPRALDLCIRSLAGQSLLPQEVLVADDGSGPETRQTVERLAGEMKGRFPVIHVWQEDIGFRKPMILNETVRRSTGDYLVFIDGDCIAHRDFLLAHRDAGSPDAIVSGKRVELGKALTERLLASGRPDITLGTLVWDSIFGRRPKTRKVEEALVVRNRHIRKALHRDEITDDGVWGCNFSLTRDLFYGINGCDEEFLDGSIEDNDLGIRVLNQGKYVRSLRNLAVIFHLWHQSSWSFENEKYRHNLAIMQRRIELKEPRCRNGIVREG